tara:strand:- start:860 stop:1129 length:270 start_codon:yes stop_codon:yes gene_type:complete
MKYLKITQKKNNQKYIENLLKTYPKISSGRKKYAEHYTRILKNLLLTKAFDLLQKEENGSNYFNYRFIFINNKKFITLKIINSNDNLNN